MDVKYQPLKKKKNSSFDNIIKSEKPVLIDFLLLGGPCKVLGPILKEVKDNLGDGISIIKIDVDKTKK
jgi:thioredoxin 1